MESDCAIASTDGIMENSTNSEIVISDDRSSELDTSNQPSPKIRDSAENTQSDDLDNSLNIHASAIIGSGQVIIDLDDSLAENSSESTGKTEMTASNIPNGNGECITGQEHVQTEQIKNEDNDVIIVESPINSPANIRSTIAKNGTSLSDGVDTPGFINVGGMPSLVRHMGPMRTSSITSVPTSSTYVVPSNVQSQQIGRQLAPNSFGVINGSIPQQGSIQGIQAVHNDRATINGNGDSMHSASLDDVLPKHLRIVLDPASVCPYRGNIMPKGFTSSPTEGYRCEECGDSFGLKSCLEFHLQRRSMIIESNCLICRQPLIFFNKCVYYGHIRSHSGGKRQIGQMIMRNVNVKPITWQLMELAFEDTAFKRMMNIDEFLAYETGNSLAPPIVDLNAPEMELERTSILDIGNAANKASIATNALQNFVSIASKVRCTECDAFQFVSASALRQHFMYNLPENQKQLICSTCHAVYFSHCSFKAHLRTHANTTPYVCPECGSLLQTSDALNAHVMTHQKNPTVMDAWKCQRCHTFYSSWDALIVHVSATHCDSYFTCSECPLVFRPFSAFEQHLATTQHDAQENSKPQGQQLTKCCQCDHVFPSRELLVEHLKTHYQKLLPFAVYRCALCGRLMENKSGLLGHFKNIHGFTLAGRDVHPVRIQVNSNEPMATAKESSKDASTSTTTTVTPPSTTFRCSDCPSLVFHSDQALTAHFKRRHQGGTETKQPKQEFACRYCERKFANPNSLLDDGIRHLLNGISICLLCKNADFIDSQLLLKHLQRHIDMQRGNSVSPNIVYKCDGHCEKSFASALDAYEHLRIIHSLPPSNHCSKCGITFSAEAVFKIHLRQVHPEESAITSSPIRQDEKRKHSYIASPPASTSTTAKKRALDVNASTTSYRCNKCGVRFQDIDQMHDHALSHKEPKYYLCLECGVSFATPASLGRHLIISHSISNVEKYVQENPDANPAKPSELECSVCHKEFTSKPLLDSHVRTHGLLFLKTKAKQATS